jgi:membrane protein implicated in regulation of membrane protease activity
MHKMWARMGVALCFALFWVDSSYALDSYRFLHVTIETPWAIFLFLLFTIFVPFVLMAVLVWRYAERKVDPKKKQAAQGEGKD